jgi:thioesterase domain-containing protein
MLSHFKAAGIIAAEIDEMTIVRHLKVMHGIRRAQNTYVPVTTDASISTFYAVQQGNLMPESIDPDLGWGAFTGGRMHTYPINGTHFSMMQQPHVGQLGAAMSSAMETSATMVSDNLWPPLRPKHG